MYSLSEKATYRLLITIKARYKRFGVVGLSRHEWHKFGTSEMRMRKIIKKMMEEGKLILKGGHRSTRCTGSIHLCNVYDLGKEFIEFLKTIKEFVDTKIVQYTPEMVLEWARSIGKKKSTEWKVKIGNNIYIVQEKGRYRGKIYSVSDNRIVPLTKVSCIQCS